MAKTMRVAVVVQFDKPLMLQEWKIARPGPRQVLVQTEVCGVCHIGVNASHGDRPPKPTPPFIPGHEAIGLVAAAGTGVTVAARVVINFV